MTQVIFYSIKNTSEKLNRLCGTANRYFLSKIPLLFLVNDPEGLDFLDKLLWKTPPESFLPHPNPFIQIHQKVQPEFSSIFNLQPSALIDIYPFKTIYEFEDHTSLGKLQLSKQRYQNYRDRHLHIIVEE